MKAEPVLDIALRLEVDDLYARYIACLDQRRYEDWPDFFTDECVYKLQPRENFERGLPLCTLSFESKGMLRDRVYSVTQTLFHQPYYQRHIVSGLQVVTVADGVISTEANYLVVRTKKNELSELFNCGRYFDKVVRENGQLKFAAKVAVFDSELIPNSLIYPV